MVGIQESHPWKGQVIGHGFPDEIYHWYLRNDVCVSHSSQSGITWGPVAYPLVNQHSHGKSPFGIGLNQPNRCLASKAKSLGISSGSRARNTAQPIWISCSVSTEAVAGHYDSQLWCLGRCEFINSYTRCISIFNMYIYIYIIHYNKVFNMIFLVIN